MSSKIKLYPEDQRWSEPRLAAFGPLKQEVKRAYLKLYAKNSRDGNIFLRDAYSCLLEASPIIRRCKDSESIDKTAKQIAKDCSGLLSLNDLNSALTFMRLEMPGHKTEEGALLRASDWKYWRRFLRREVGRYQDQIMRLTGFVHKRKQIYCSDVAVEGLRKRSKANMELLENMRAVSDYGDEITLAELHLASLANPYIRSSELLVRLRGMENWADNENHEKMFFTITVPSKYHARHAASGDYNSKYNGATPRETQAYLMRVWRRVRAKLARDNIPIYGIRVVEPHHDGTPHLHGILFFDIRHTEAVKRAIRTHALAEDGTEPGALEHRVDFKRIDEEKGSAVGYLIKYICKNIDGKGVGEDMFGNPAEWAANRVVAWARLWGIRQFAQIGASQVGVWREYRRLREDPLQPHSDAWSKADTGDYCGFMAQMGGAVPGRADQPTTLIRGIRVSTVSGQCTPAVNKWGEPISGSELPITGLVRDGVELNTRPKFWTIEKVAKPKDPEIFVFPEAEGVGARTRVNNCTRDGDQKNIYKQCSHLNGENSGIQEPTTGPPS